MAVLSADFETGSNGATLTTSDAGSSTPFTSVFGTPKYDSSQAAHGSLAMKCVSAGDYLNWSEGSNADQYIRFYVRLSALPASPLFLFQATSAGAAAWQIYVTSAGRLSIQAANGKGATTTSAVAANSWFRVEAHCANDPAAGNVQLRYFASPDSTSATETVNQTAMNTLAANDAVQVGALNLGVTVWLDNLAVNAPSYPGPFPVNTAAPAITGATVLGSVLTATAGTWNVGTTTGYQWQRDVHGSGVYTNIGGSTASTYTLAALDNGCNVRCLVTATGLLATNESVSIPSNPILDTTGGTPSGSFSQTVGPVEQRAYSADVGPVLFPAETVGEHVGYVPIF